MFQVYVIRVQRVLTAVLAGALVFGVSCCTLHEVGEVPDPPVHIPQRFSETVKAAAPDRWWEAFDDPELNSLIEQALAGNLELKGAWSRLDQAAALAVQAGAGLLPEVTAEANATRTRTDKPTARVKSTDNLFSLGLVASYEVDLWGRVRSLKGAAESDLRATREDLDAVAITLAASVGETWFALVEQRAQKNLLAEQVKVNETFLELTELRFSQGQASALDVYQQRQHLAATRSQFAPVEARLSVLRNQLDVLRGRPPLSESPADRDTLPELPPLPGTGLPADLLEQRPDLRAGYHRLYAADQRVAAAVADRLPALRLTGRAGYQDNISRDVFNNWVWSLAGNLAAPVFDAGRRKAEVRRAKAEVAGRLHEYGRLVLQAIQEVEDAMVQERQQRIFLADLDSQVALAQATLKEARARYMTGLSDYLPVLTALATLHKLERERLSAHQQLLSFRIQLCRALGGSWTKKIKPGVEMSFLSNSGDAQ